MPASPLLISATLCPACASYDQFKNFAMRGAAFKKLVGDLP